MKTKEKSKKELTEFKKYVELVVDSIRYEEHLEAISILKGKHKEDLIFSNLISSHEELSKHDEEVGFTNLKTKWKI